MPVERIERAVQEENPAGQGVSEVVFCRIENPFAARPEAAQCRPQDEAQMVGRRFRVVLRFVRRQRLILRPIYRRLGPILSMTPRGMARTPELDGGLAVHLMLGKRDLYGRTNGGRIHNGYRRKTIDITRLKTNRRIQGLDNGETSRRIELTKNTRQVVRKN